MNTIIAIPTLILVIIIILVITTLAILRNSSKKEINETIIYLNFSMIFLLSGFLMGFIIGTLISDNRPTNSEKEEIQVQEYVPYSRQDTTLIELKELNMSYIDF